jgi:hypothetical protein
MLCMFSSTADRTNKVLAEVVGSNLTGTTAGATNQTEGSASEASQDVPVMRVSNDA